MTDVRSTSRERNAPRATIGRDGAQPPQARLKTPGPANYNTVSSKSIGDDTSVKVPFGRATRPISAKPGQIS